MLLRLIFKKLFIVIAIQLNKIEKNNSFNVKTRTETNPNICGENSIDSVFNDEKNQICITRRDWIWAYNQLEKRLENADKQNPKESHLLQTKVYFSQTPDCQIKANNNCDHIKRAKDLIIILHKQRNADFTGSYRVGKVINGFITDIDDKAILPLGLQRNGNIYSSGHTFWPKELSLNEKQINKKQTAMIYSPKDYKFIIIANGDSKVGTKLLWTKLDPNKSWSNQWNSKNMNNEWTYVGMFRAINNSVYAVGVKGSDNKIFVYSEDNELKESQLNVQQLIGCGVRSRAYYGFVTTDSNGSGNTSGLETNDNTTLIIIVVIVVLIKIVIVLIVAILICLCFKRKYKNKISQKQNQSSEEQKFGIIDSDLKLNIEVSEISTASTEAAIEEKKKPNNESIGKFFMDKKKKKKKY
jgi:hypothetical protein